MKHSYTSVLLKLIADKESRTLFLEGNPRAEEELRVVLDETEFRLITQAKPQMNHIARSFSLPDNLSKAARQLSFPGFFLFCSLFLVATDGQCQGDFIPIATGIAPDMPAVVSSQGRLLDPRGDELRLEFDKVNELLRIYCELHFRPDPDSCTKVYLAMENEFNSSCIAKNVEVVLSTNASTPFTLEVTKVAMLTAKHFCLLDYVKTAGGNAVASPTYITFGIKAGPRGKGVTAVAIGTSTALLPQIGAALGQFPHEGTSPLIGHEFTISLSRVK